VFCLDKCCIKWSQHPYVRMFLPLTGITYYIIFQCFSFAVKEVLINPSNNEKLRVDKLTMVFNCPGKCVGTTIEPNVPPGISKMFVFDFVFFIFFFLLWELLFIYLFFFLFYNNCEIFFFFLLFYYCYLIFFLLV
jgi:hypothetical protein